MVQLNSADTSGKEQSHGQVADRLTQLQRRFFFVVVPILAAGDRKGYRKKTNCRKIVKQIVH